MVLTKRPLPSRSLEVSRSGRRPHLGYSSDLTKPLGLNRSPRHERSTASNFWCRILGLPQAEFHGHFRESRSAFSREPPDERCGLIEHILELQSRTTSQLETQSFQRARRRWRNSDGW